MAAYTTIDDPSAYFQVKTYTGNGGTQSITLDGNSDLSPNWVWIKDRGNSTNHMIFDTVRGATKELHTQNNDTESTQATTLTAFGSDGFSLGAQADVNDSSDTYVSWNWKEDTTAGFDIIAYQGTGSNLDVSHNLSAVPDWIMIKNRDVDQAWRVYHKSMGFSKRLVLSESGAESTSALGLDADPTSSVINIGTGTGCTNASGEDFICYAFKNVQGFSKFGSYTGVDSITNNSFIYLGFSPAWVMIKKTNGTNDWGIFDNKRNSFNPTGLALDASNGNAESVNGTIDMLSNGFKVRSDSGLTGDGEYIYMAFAENPFVTSSGVPATAR